MMNDTTASAAKRLENRAAKESPGKLTSTHSRMNNSWYSECESGERREVIRGGVFPPIESSNQNSSSKWSTSTRSAGYFKDKYSNDPLKRDSYVNDCTNGVRRDWKLRFAAGPTSAGNHATQFPPIRFGEYHSRCKDPTEYFRKQKMTPLKGAGTVPVRSSPLPQHRYYGIEAKGLERKVNGRDHVTGYGGFVGRIQYTVGKAEVVAK